MFLEVHQPIGHGQIADVEQRAIGLERGGIFAVRVDHHDMALRCELADAMKDQGRAGRLAGAGRSEQREMLAQHRIDIERGADVPGRIDIADFDVRAIVGGVDLAQVRGRYGKDPGAGWGVAGDATAEAIELAGQLLLDALAEKVDLGDDPAAGIVEAKCADIGHEPARA